VYQAITGHCWVDKSQALNFIFWGVVVLGFNLRASWLLGMCFTTWAKSPGFVFYGTYFSDSDFAAASEHFAFEGKIRKALYSGYKTKNSQKKKKKTQGCHEFI
jgi:hypothetical protein